LYTTIISNPEKLQKRYLKIETGKNINNYYKKEEINFLYPEAGEAGSHAR
jgi:hypothetical protein